MDIDDMADGSRVDPGPAVDPMQQSHRDLNGIGLFGVVAVPLLLLYLATATWSLPYHIDAATNVFTAWELGERGDALLDDHEVLASDDYYGNIGWIVPAGATAAAVYPPGTALMAAPLYAVWPVEASTLTVYGTNTEASAVEVPIPPLAPAAITAALAAAIAVGLMALIFRELATARVAVVAAYIAGLCTGIWPVMSDALWQHGPAIMWMSAGILLSIRRPLASGVAFGAAIITRPHTAFVPACNGRWQSWTSRSLKPAASIGVGSFVGLAGLVWFNNAVFGTPSIAGGYGDRFAERMASLDVLDYAGNVVLVFVDPMRGLLVYSPFLLVLIPGLRIGWRAAPAWVRGSAIGGILYLLLQLKAEGFSGGSGFWGYRYPLETIAAAAPLLLLAYTQWLAKASPLVRRAFAALLVASLVLTATGAVFF